MSNANIHENNFERIWGQPYVYRFKRHTIECGRSFRAGGLERGNWWARLNGELVTSGHDTMTEARAVAARVAERRNGRL